MSRSKHHLKTILTALVLACFTYPPAHAATKPDTSKMPWMNKALSPDERADLVLKELTLDEKISMVHGAGWGVLRKGAPVDPHSNFAAGYMPGIERLGIPGIRSEERRVGKECTW